MIKCEGGELSSWGMGAGRKKKLSRQWQGPCRILEQTGPVNFRVQHISRPRGCQLVRENRLKRAHGMEEAPPPPVAGQEVLNPPPTADLSSTWKAPVRATYPPDLARLPPIFFAPGILPSHPLSIPSVSSPPPHHPPPPPPPATPAVQPPSHRYRLRSQGPVPTKA
ncbi:hypothetical protein J437_LFUL018193 [Ladona fulva]|uniref:Integrase p58-like C-terminal domain-containing protein n=1 Tax=Ladona fulva TaxID=123851 RepID=A0A8K0KNW4_LADFU|nr:hypothetical protein J437_LFUL018193 [Ladona fulva]